MSQKSIIGLLIAIILVGAGVWFYTKNSADRNEATNTQSDTSTATENTNNGMLEAVKSGAGDFAQFFTGGQEMECRFEGVDPETKEYTEGTVFIAGENFAMQADTTIDGKKGKINMIQHEKIMYMWSDDTNAMPGIKIDTIAFAETEGVPKPNSPIDWLKDPEAGVEYSCKGWSPRSDSFTPPANVQFMDMMGGMGQMMQQGIPEGE
jgi:hypothetical protein